jgi:hypothetical protein
MTTINRIDQAVLLLKDRLDKLGSRSNASASQSAGTSRSGPADPLGSLRLLVRQGKVSPQELRKAMVRLLLTEAFGDEMSGSLDFQSLADQVTEILESHEHGRDLLVRAISELG